MNSEVIVDITLENAQEYLIDESHNRPVLVDFWADWCGPCKTLMPILEKLANEYQGQFLLAKVNADELQIVAGQFGVQSLPTVMLMKDGQPVDGFAGAQPEKQVRELLDKHLPKPWDTALNSALALMESGNHSEALSLLQSAYSDSGQQANISFALVTCLIVLKRYDEADKILSDVKLADQNNEFEALKSQLQLAQEAQKTPEIAELEAKCQADPENKELAFQLAVQYSQNSYAREALDILFELVRTDLNFKDGEAKKAYLDILSVLGKSDPLAAQYQRKLYTLLY